MKKPILKYTIENIVSNIGIDYWVISDTGSMITQLIIAETFQT